MARFKAFIFFLFIIWSSWAFCQDEVIASDSLRVISFSIHKLDTTVFIEKGGSNIDTSSRYFHKYDPIDKAYLFNANTGNIGASSVNMVFKPLFASGFQYGNRSFFPYINSDQDQNFFYALKPFTELHFSSGMKREQVFHVTHMHHVRNKLFMGVNYRIINAPGRDNYHQKTNDHAVSTFMYYQTKNKRYGVFADYLFSRIKCQENGGMVDDTVYLNYRSGQSLTMPEYYLTTAENRVKESAVHLKQYYFLARKDSFMINDSTKGGRKILLGRFVHSFDFVHHKDRFSNGPNMGYFPLIPNDSGPRADSSLWFQVKNTIGWTNHELRPDDKQAWLRYALHIAHSYTEIRDAGGMYHFINVQLSASLGLRLFKHLTLDVAGAYVLLNDFKNDFNLSGTAAYAFFRKEKSYGSIAVEVDWMRREADWFYRHYRSTYYNWDNRFLKEEVLHAGLNYSYPRLKVGVDYYNWFNPVYMDAGGRPNQYVNGVINVFSAYVFKKFVFWKFEIDNKVIYQYTDKPALLRKPALMAAQSYVFSTHMFRKALFFQVGVDLRYHTKYYGDAYLTGVRAFYLQNDRKVGNYLNADAFLNLKIKRFRVFLALTNFLSGVIGYDNFSVPHYPMQDRVFKFGVNWLFHD